MTHNTVPPAPPAIPSLDLRPTGRLPYTVANARQAATTMKTALAALDAAAQLRQKTGELAALYGVRPVFTVTPERIGFAIETEPAGPREALAGDVALLTGADLHPDIDPGDLWVTLTGCGVHNGHGVWITLLVPPLDVAESGGDR